MSEYISGKYFTGRITNDIRAVEKALTERFLKNNQFSDDTEIQDWINRIEDLSEGKNTVIIDDKGLPSIYYRMPVRTRDQLVGDGSNDYFESWIVDNALISELYVAKYQAHNVTVESQAYAVSLYGLDPTANINFDNALAACTRKGTGHSLNTNANWMQLVLDSYTNGAFQIHGNDSYGKFSGNPTERGEGSYRYDSSGNKQVGRTKTGTGPNTWSHDGTPFGVFDMRGNVSEWVGGLKTASGGEILVLPNNDAMNSANSQAAAATTYKGISATDGSYQDAGTSGNLFYGMNGSVPGIGDDSITASTGSTNTPFKDLAAVDITVPDIAIRLGLAPISGGNQQGRFYHNGSQEDMAYRGGSFYSATNAGAFSLYLDGARTSSYNGIGFRSAFYR
jgi:hypothetical protein